VAVWPPLGGRVVDDIRRTMALLLRTRWHEISRWLVLYGGYFAVIVRSVFASMADGHARP